MYKIVDNTIKTKKVSIIIPIYGVEFFIERCAISLFEQTLDDIEYIFVDDCTMDKSVQILQGVIAKYPQRKDNVFIIRHERNKGLTLFNGRYSTDYGGLFAATTISILPVILVYVIFQKRFVAGVASGAVKG